MNRAYVLRKKAALDFLCKTLDGMRLGFLSSFLRWTYRRWCKRQIFQYIDAYVSIHGVPPTAEYLSDFLKWSGEEFLLDGDF